MSQMFTASPTVPLIGCQGFKHILITEAGKLTLTGDIRGILKAGMRSLWNQLPSSLFKTWSESESGQYLNTLRFVTITSYRKSNMEIKCAIKEKLKTYIHIYTRQASNSICSWERPSIFRGLRLQEHNTMLGEQTLGFVHTGQELHQLSPEFYFYIIANIK